MDSGALQNVYYIAEIIGIAAVIGSLVFVGLQVSQNTKQLKTDSLWAGTDRLVRSFLLTHSTESDAHDFRNGLTNFANLSPDKKATFQSKMASQVAGFNQAHFLYRNGLLEPDHFAALERTFLAVIPCRGALEWWQQFKYLPPAMTVSFIDKRISEGKGKIRAVVETLDCFKNS